MEHIIRLIKVTGRLTRVNTALLSKTFDSGVRMHNLGQMHNMKELNTCLILVAFRHLLVNAFFYTKE